MSNWIEWNGGECPVAIGTPVDVRHRDGDVFFAETAGRGSAHDWDNDGFGGDIVAYREHSQPLLSAAPELLEVLERLKIEVVLSDVDPEYIESHFRPWLDKAEAVMLKARGN